METGTAEPLAFKYMVNLSILKKTARWGGFEPSAMVVYKRPADNRFLDLSPKG